MAFTVNGGIEWEKDEASLVLTVRPTNSPQSGFTKGQMDDFGMEMIGPWGTITEYGWTLVLEDGITNIGGYAFNYCSGFVGSLVIPDSVTSIGDQAFMSCTSFDGTLSLGNGVTMIGASAFQGCGEFIGSLTIPNGVTEIPQGAFADCSGFNGTLAIGSGVTDIGGYAFSGCQSFKEVYFLSETAPSLAEESMYLDHRSGSTQTYDCYSPGNWAETAMTSEVSGSTIWRFRSLTSDSISIKVDGVWKNGTPYVNVNGVWKKGKTYIKSNGEWKQGR